METRNEILAAGLVSRAVALALAFVAATVVSIGSAAVVTQGADRAETIHAKVPAEKAEIRYG
jgi:hypothetical protein